MITRPLLMLVGILFVSALGADEYHYNDILVGDRASGMGGAYTAISDDPSGMYYNPAGIIYAPATNTSSSAFAYQSKSKRYKGAIGTNDWIRTSSSFIPNFFGVLQPIGDSMWGLSYVMTEAVDEHQAQSFTNLNLSGIDLYTIDLDRQDSVYMIGPSYASRINDRWTYGVSLYLQIRDQITSFQQVADLSDGSHDVTSQQIAISELGFNPVFGLMWEPAERISVGLTARKAFIFDAQRRIECTKQAGPISGTICGTSYAANQYIHPQIIEDHFYFDPPWELGMGWAMFPNNKEVVSTDVKFYVGGARVNTWNASIGYEYFINSKWNTRFGVYTNNANTATPTLYNAVEHVDELGMSLSLGRFTRTSSISLGMAYLTGSGYASGISDAASTLTPVNSDSFSLYLTAFYTN